MKRSNVIALAGISAATCYVAIILSFYVDIMSVSFGAIAGICLMLPLTAGSITGAIFAYVSASILAGLTVGFGSLNFIIFFGPFTIICYLVDFKLYDKLKLPKWLKITISYIIKGIYYSAAVTGVYYIMKAFGNVDALFESNWKWLAIVALIIIFFLFDLLLHMVFVNLRYIINTRILKNRGADTARPPREERKEQEIDVFGMDESGDEDSKTNNDASSNDDNEDASSTNSTSSNRFEHFLEAEKRDDNASDDDDEYDD